MRITVRETLLDVENLASLASSVPDWLERFGKDAWISARCDCRDHDCYPALEVEYEREETPDETQARERAERSKEAKERAEYERLCKKFAAGGTPPKENAP